MRRRFAIALLMVSLSIPASAADRADKSTLLSVDLARGTITNVTRKEETALIDSNTFTVRRNETTTIEIAQQNPLLFLYESKLEKADTDEYKAALEFAKQVQAFLALFPAGLGANVTKRSIRGFEPAGFQDDLKSVMDYIAGVGNDLAASLGTAEEVAALKKRYSDRNIDGLSARIDRAYTGLTEIGVACLKEGGQLQTDDGQTVICDGPAAINTNIALVAAIATASKTAADAKAASAKLDEARAQLAVVQAQRKQAGLSKDAQAQLAARETQLTQAVADAQTASTTAADDASRAEEDVQELRAMRPTLIGVITLALGLKPDIQRHLTTLKSIDADVALLQTPLKLATIPYSIQRQTLTVDVKASTKYDSFITASTRQKRAATLRKFTMVVEPYQPAHLSLAPAFVVGFVRSPEFTATKKGDIYVIQKKDQLPARYTLGAMINITPDSWQEPTFGGHFQLGITPTKDALAFYAGAGIRTQRILTFGGGVMLQQVKQLAGGLTLQSELKEAADLKTSTTFKTGLYLHATVEIPK